MRAPRTRLVAITLAATALFALLLAPNGVRASSDIVRHLSFVGVSTSQHVYCVEIRDADRGDAFAIYKLRGGKVIASRPFERSTRKKVLAGLRRKYALDDKGVAGQTSPKEDVTIVGAPRGGAFEVLVMEGARIGVLSAIALAEPRKGAPAERVMLGAVVWSSDGKYVFVTLNHKQGGQQQADEDTIDALRYLPWRVRWR